MREIFTQRHLVVTVFIFIFNLVYAQTDEQRKAITSTYDLEALNELSNEFNTYYAAEKRKALKYALDNNLETIIKDGNGGVAILQQVLEDGTLLYLSTYNDTSAVTINTNNVHSGGDRNLNLDGTGIELGIWDGGLVRLTHQEFTGRITQLDNPSSLSSHATHVSGTMIAAGIDPQAKGMAYNASLLAYSFENDIAEMLSEASNGMLLSNHSYGYSPSQLPPEIFGAYVPDTRSVDQITYNAPYYLPVFAAGNSRNNNPPYNPSKNGYDLISGRNLAKNILSVANVIQVPNYTGPASVNIWTTSSFGPTDDGRIKPDIAAQGRNVYSSTSNDDDTYANVTGTSMAAPAVTGSLGLLQQHHQNMYGSFLTAASLRAIVIHTAREAGDFPGPDYEFGFGLMNTAAAADIITNKGFTTILEENTLSDGGTYNLTVEALDPSIPLMATLAWTDPPATVQDTTVPDDPTPRLINDLDIKITDQNGNVVLPWKLDPTIPTTAAIQGDNIVDNVEKIEINNPSGIYNIEVSHKGSLVDLEQDYSLVVSGIKESDFSVFAIEASESYCANDTAIFQFNVNSVPGFTGNINLSQTGLPASVTAVFIPSTISDSGSTTLFISDLDTVSPGDYTFTVNATSGAITSSFDLSLEVKPANPLSNLTVVSPDPNGDDTDLNPFLEWSSNPEAAFYELEVSTSSNFDTILESIQTTQTSYQMPELDSATNYFWRVRPVNECVIGAYTVSDFTTKFLTCSSLITAADTPVVISDVGANQVQSTVSVPDTFLGLELEDVNIHLNISHSFFSDLTVTLTSPQGTSVVLLEEQCDEFNDADVVIDDKGLDPNCSAVAPTLSGTIKGIESLAAFKGEFFNGVWTLTVDDGFDADGGTIENFALEICYEDLLSVENQLLSQFKIYPNPAESLVNISLPPNLNTVENIEIFDISGRQIEVVDVKDQSQVQFNVGNHNAGIYLVKVHAANASLVKKLIVK
jgi:subtilisin-like proprotein convertase family protein